MNRKLTHHSIQPRDETSVTVSVGSIVHLASFLGENDSPVTLQSPSADPLLPREIFKLFWETPGTWQRVSQLGVGKIISSAYKTT